MWSWFARALPEEILNAGIFAAPRDHDLGTVFVLSQIVDCLAVYRGAGNFMPDICHVRLELLDTVI